jgi:sugar O-acyltransferase (sialic acid O-acetyltransferase NeuD family)
MNSIVRTGTNAFDLAIFGAGGHAREIAWIARRNLGVNARITFVVDQGEVPERLNGLGVIGLGKFLKLHSLTPIIIAIGDPTQRRSVHERLREDGLHFRGLVDPEVILSEFVTIGEGTIIFPGTILTTNIVIGDHTHINLSCTISHDVHIGEFCQLSPGVNISGQVRVGNGVFIGTNASIINGSPSYPLEIGDNVVIGAGACVIRSAPSGSRLIGVPAIPK